MNQSTIIVIVPIVLLASFARGQNDTRLLTAQTVAVVASVEYLRVDNAKYDNQKEVNRIIGLVEDAGLFRTPRFPHAPYRATTGDKADILITIEESVALPRTVSIVVRDPDTNDELFREKRDLVELGNDIKRLIKHFLTHVEETKAESERAEELATRQKREAQAAVDAARADRQCTEEEAAFTRNIISTVTAQYESVPPMTQDIIDHNQKCPHNLIVPEGIVKHYRAEVAAKEAAEHARLEQIRRDEEKEKVLSALKQELAATPFVAPSAGRMRLDYQLPVPTGYYYIIPSDGKPDTCTFPRQEIRKLKGAKSAIAVGVLDCLRTRREAFVVLTASEHFYLIQAIKFLSAETERIGIVKDKGTTICFHEGGCQHVLAEVRLVPTDLPHKVQIPLPGPLTATYDSDGFSLRYPQNWRVSRRNGANFINIVPPEGQVGSWATHGIFVMHFAPVPSFPTTVAGALERVIDLYQKQGRVFQAQRTLVTVGGREGLMAAYSASSPVSGEERGRLILILDGSGGFYEFWTFSPGPENESYRAVFDNILGTAQFNTNPYATDLYSGTIHNQTANKSARLEVAIRNEEGKLSGCTGIREPLYGSGSLKGVTKDGTVTFTVNGNGFDLFFRGRGENGGIAGTYTVPPIGSAGVAQEGDFHLEKAGSKFLLIQPCPTDQEMNANSH
jgi:hypothetical protein